MDESTRNAFSQFVYNSHIRVPEVHRNSSLHQNPELVLNDILNSEVAKSTRYDEIKEKFDDLAFRKKMIKNATTLALTQQNPNIFEALSGCSFSWLVPNNSENQFVIGSRPVVWKPNDMTTYFELGTLFPITRKLCLEIAFEEKDSLVNISGELVDEINRLSVAQSRFCVGPDRSGIKRLFAD